MALSGAEKQRAYRERRKLLGVGAGKLVKELEGRVVGLEVSVRALESRLRSVEDQPVSVASQPVEIDHSRLRPPVAMNPAMQAFVQQHPPRPVTVPHQGVPNGPMPTTVDDWEPA